MRNFIVILIIIQLVFIPIPVEAGRDNIYTAVTYVNLDEIKQVDINYTIIKFDIQAAILNTGSEFSQDFHSMPTEYTLGNVYLDGVENDNIDVTFMDMCTSKVYPERQRVEYNSQLRISITDQSIDYLPDGNITIWFYTDQPDINTFYAYVKITQGEISYDYDALPSFWLEYPLFNESSSEPPLNVSISEIKITWFPILLIFIVPLEFFRRRRIKRSIN